MFTFRLPARARVTFTVLQVAPVCRIAGRFRVGGKTGANRIPFDGRIGGRRLSPGTYRIDARAGIGPAVLEVTLVLVGGGAPSRDELASARRRDVCSASSQFASAGGDLTSASAGGSGSTPNGLSSSGGASSSSSSPASSSSPSAQGGDNDNGATSTSDSVEPQIVASGPTGGGSGNAAQPLLVVALALSILMLGLAALPQAALPGGPRMTDLLARRRLPVALAGAAALVTAVAVLLIQ